MNVKKVILQELEKPLKELGYLFVKEKAGPGYYPFFKKDKIGFDVGLALDKSTWSKTIRPDIIIPTSISLNIFYITQGKHTELFYQDENELRSQLRKVISEFVAKGDSWINENMIEKFDVYQIFETYADDFFKEYGFERVHIGENLPVGSRVIYRKGKTDVEFNHSDTYLKLDCTIVKGNSIELLGYGTKRYNKENPLMGRIKSQEDYIRVLQANINELKDSYLQKSR